MVKKLISIFIFENSLFQILVIKNRKFYLRTFDINMIDNIFTEFDFDDNNEIKKYIKIKYIKLLIKDLDPILLFPNIDIRINNIIQNIILNINNIDNKNKQNYLIDYREILFKHKKKLLSNMLNNLFQNIKKINNNNFDSKIKADNSHLIELARHKKNTIKNNLIKNSANKNSKIKSDNK